MGTTVLFKLTDMYDWIRFGRIALQNPQGKADQQRLHLWIAGRRLIQALLGYTTLSRGISKKEKEKKTIKKGGIKKMKAQRVTVDGPSSSG